VVTGYGKDKVIVKRTSELEVGDKLIKSDYPVIQGDDELEFAYDNGFYSADGCYFEGRQIIYLYHEKRELINQFPSVVRWYEQADQKRLVGTAKGLRDKFFVPAANYTIQSKLEWFAGLCDGDGTIARNGTNEALQISSTQKRFLLDTQLLLQTLGIPSKVTKNVDEGMKMLPANDGSGELKAFFCQTTYRLLISSSALFKLKLLGFKTFRLQWKGEMPQREAEQFTRVVSVTDEGRKDDTYCFTEHKRHLGVFNGLLTGNCNEIMLFSDINHTFTCIVSSLNVAKYREWQNTDTPFWATVFLDCVCEEFIQRARGISGLERAVRFTEKGRALGLGQCGLHTLFQQEMLPFEGLEAHLLSTSISKQIAEESLRASQWMAQVLGEPEWCKGYGVRNTHRTAIMPTKSTALLMGGVSEGINPDPAMTFTQMTAGGEVERVNPILLPLMKERGVYNKDTIRGMKQAMGSVQHVTWLTEEEKEVFKTAFELNQSVIIRMAATRTKNLCQWQSLNLFFSAEAHESEVSRVHQEALLNKDILGLYYVYSSAGVQAATGECIACQ
jgi:ribonucleoside-diphosphate reductase alpha chain